MTKNDDTAITMMTKITDGRLPEKTGEIVAERWVLLNLGIEPVINQEVNVINEETGKEKKLVWADNFACPLWEYHAYRRF